MRPILALALKDLRVLPRIRMAFFFTFIWPVDRRRDVRLRVLRLR